MIKKIKKFQKLTAKERALFIEAYYTLGVMRAAILRIPFKRLVRSLDHQAKNSDPARLNEEERQSAISIGAAIRRAAANTPWESACLAQSLAAQKMLKRRGIPGVFYLGAARDEESREKMKAHAWTQCGDEIVTGAEGHEAFTVLSVFGWR